MADAVSKLLDMIRKAKKEADDFRAAEKKPHDDAAKAVQEKWKPLITRCDLAADAAKKALTPYLEAVEREKRAVAEAARKAADEQARGRAGSLACIPRRSRSPRAGGGHA
jgi:hypothetical protein